MINTCNNIFASSVQTHGGDAAFLAVVWVSANISASLLKKSAEDEGLICAYVAIFLSVRISGTVLFVEWVGVYCWLID